MKKNYNTYYNKAQAVMIQAHQAFLNGEKKLARVLLDQMVTNLLLTTKCWNDNGEEGAILPVDLIDSEQQATEEAARWASKKLDLSF